MHETHSVNLVFTETLPWHQYQPQLVMSQSCGKMADLHYGLHTL